MMISILIWLFVFIFGSLAVKIPSDVTKSEALDANKEPLKKENSGFSSASNDAVPITKRGSGRSARWLKANTSPVCFGARNHQFGRFKAPKSGLLASVKLVHLYGYVSCHTYNPSFWSFWGCGHNGRIIDHIGVAITTSSNYILLPPSQFMQFGHRAGKWSKIPGYNSFSPKIVLSRFSHPYWVYSGQQLRLWYTEDLVDWYETDNGGRVCCDVYALYA